MIVGRFDSMEGLLLKAGSPSPRLLVDERVLFLLDTGADSTCLHPRDADPVGIPFSRLGNRVYSRGIGGSST